MSDSSRLWRELLARYLVGELSPDEHALFSQLLNEDKARRAELDAWQAVAEAVRQEADARANELPVLPESFYQRLNQHHTLNGSVRQSIKENRTMTTIARKQKTSERSRSISFAAAILTVLGFVGTLLLTRNVTGPVGNLDMVGLQAQETATPVMDELVMTATAIIAGATGTAECETAGVCTTSTATPAALLLTATPIPAQPMAVTVVPTVPPPAASQIDPIISAPARLSSGFIIGGDGVVVSIAASPDGNLIAVNRNAGTLHSIWLVNLATGEQNAIFVYDVPLVGPTFSPDGSELYVSTSNGQVFVLHLRT